MYLSNPGHCPICEQEVTFTSEYSWLRGHYRCSNCQSAPRFRALMHTLNLVRPAWRAELVHESSPSSPYFAKRAPGYTCSYYFPDAPLGGDVGGRRCENLEALTFSNGAFDVFITSDVMEHVFRPDKAFAEISRVLRDGGIHIFTAPRKMSTAQSTERARLENGEIVHLAEPEYHGNPIDAKGSLVTWDYGRDFESLVEQWSGYLVSTYTPRDRRFGLDGQLLEVFVVQKHADNAYRGLDTRL